MYARALAALSLLALAAACTPTGDKAEVEARPPVPSTGGFAPLRAETITVPGGGQWICVPSTQAAAPSRCEPQLAGRPGLVPVPNPLTPVDGAAPASAVASTPQDTGAPSASDTAAALAAARRAGADIPMDVPN